MDSLQAILPDSWLAWVTAGVAFCAAITVVLPPPKENSGSIYKAVYRLIQWVALNLGRAKNAQDQPAPEASPTQKTQANGQR